MEDLTWLKDLFMKLPVIRQTTPYRRVDAFVDALHADKQLTLAVAELLLQRAKFD